ncbi:MAG: GNAT family N-acetyltransferase [Clostridia bacterium]|nr:GNAT family N-acetyltransferase [Clostridia bacterium]
MLELDTYREEDASVILSWIDSELSFRKWSADRYPVYPITPEDMNRFYRSQEKKGFFLPLTAREETEPVGHLVLRFPESDRSVLRFGFVIVDSRIRGRGYGKQMIRLALRYGFETCNAKKITIGVFENNEPALRCYLSAGFHSTGEVNPYPILGQTWNCLELECLSPE